MIKRNLLASVICTIIGTLNAVLYMILVDVGVMQFSIMAYLFFIGYLACVWLPFVVDIFTKSDFDTAVIVAYQIFVFVSVVLGSIWRMYDIWTGYDFVIHFASGILVTFIAHSVLERSKNNKQSQSWHIFTIFAMAVMVGALWEIWEFCWDGILGYNAQQHTGLVGRAALMDTMLDLICDTIGAMIGCIITAIRMNIENKRMHKTM